MTSMVTQAFNILVSVAFVVGLCGAAIVALRLIGLSRPQPTQGAGRVSSWTLVSIIYAILAAVGANWCRLHYLHGSRPATVAVFGVLLLVPCLGLGLRWLILTDWTLLRIHQRVQREDRDGAIAELQALVDPRSDRFVPALAATADPWAPPQAEQGSDQRLAVRLNNLGAYLTARGDWAEALDRFRAAERVGDPNRIIRANIGLALTKLGQAEEGFAVLDQALASVPERRLFDRSLVLLLRAEALADAGRWVEVQAALDQSTELLRASGLIWPAARRIWATQFAQVQDQLRAGRGAIMASGHSTGKGGQAAARKLA